MFCSTALPEHFSRNTHLTLTRRNTVYCTVGVQYTVQFPYSTQFLKNTLQVLYSTLYSRCIVHSTLGVQFGVQLCSTLQLLCQGHAILVHKSCVNSEEHGTEDETVR